MTLASNLKILRNFSTNEKQNTSYLVRVIFLALFSELKVISMNSDWFIELFVSVVIGPSYYLGFGFFDRQKSSKSCFASHSRRWLG